jgi:hypothetical protein
VHIVSEYRSINTAVKYIYAARLFLIYGLFGAVLFKHFHSPHPEFVLKRSLFWVTFTCVKKFCIKKFRFVKPFGARLASKVAKCTFMTLPSFVN